MKRTHLLLGTLLVTTSLLTTLQAEAPATATAPAPPVVHLWPAGKMPGTAATQPESTLPSRGDNATRITNISDPTLTRFPVPNKNAPTLIISPGGGYTYVVYDKEGTDIAAWLNAHGIGALVLKYRTPANRDGALQDLQRALSLARANADAWNIDPKRLGVIGFSAGGHASAKASTLFDKRTYTPIDAVDQQPCRPDFALLVYPAYLEKDDNVAPDLDLKAKIPPTLIVQTEDDKSFVNGGKLYHAALDQAGITNDYLLYPTGGHGYGLRATGAVRVWTEAALEWLHKIGIQ